MKKLVVLLEILSLLLIINIPNGLSQKRISSNLVSFSTSAIEFLVDSFEKEYIQYIDTTISIDDENWEVYCELEIPGIPRERILMSKGINPSRFSFSPFIRPVRLSVGKDKIPVILSRINIQYIFSWEDKPGTYQGRLIFTYKNKNGFIPLAQLPIVINIKPIFSVSIYTESNLDKRNLYSETSRCNSDTDITFLVLKPGEWESLETIWLTIKTNYWRWNIQCSVTDLVDTTINKTIPASYIHVKSGANSNYVQLSKGYTPIISGSSGGVIGPIPVKFKLKSDKSVLAGEYNGKISLLFGGM